MAASLRNALLIILVLALGIVASVQLNLHTLEHHAAMSGDVLGYYTGDGVCKTGNEAIMFTPKLNRWMYLCFLKDNSQIAIWVLLDKISNNGVAREITRFFGSPNYLTNCAAKYGYYLVESSGDLPVWFIALFGGG